MTMFGKRAPKRQTEAPAWARKFLLTGEEPKHGEDGRHEWLMAYHLELSPPGEQRALKAMWSEHKAALLTEWIAEHPGTRPWAWWEFKAPGSRLKVGGSGVLYDHGDDVVAGFDLPGDGMWDEDPDPEDPPRFESQAAYLKRHGLLTAEERRRLKPRHFKPEVLTFDGGGEAA